MSLDSLMGLKEGQMLYIKGYSIARDDVTGLYRIKHPNHKHYFIGERVLRHGHVYYNLTQRYERMKQ